MKTFYSALRSFEQSRDFEIADLAEPVYCGQCGAEMAWKYGQLECKACSEETYCEHCGGPMVELIKGFKVCGDECPESAE